MNKNQMDGKQHTIAFTGHRMNRIRTGREELSRQLRAAIIRFYKEGYRTCLSGMAEGLDLLAAEEVLKVREQYPGLKLHCIIPFRGQPARMSPEDKLRYNAVLEASDLNVCLSEYYYDGCFLRRNDYLVRESSQLIAYYDHVRGGGTYYTVKSAEKRGIPVFNLFGAGVEAD